MKTFNFLIAYFCSILALSAQQVGWTLLHDKTLVEWDGLPATAAEKLESMRQRNRLDMHCIAFPHSAQGWIMAYHTGIPGQGASYNKSWEEVPRDLVEQVQGLCDKSIHVRQIVFFHADLWDNMGWLILYADNEALWKNIPEGLAAAIRNMHQAKRRIVNIATSRDGGWVLIADNGEYFSEKIPTDLEDALKDLKSKNAKIQQIAFHAVDGWVLIHDNYEVLWKNIPESLRQRLVELHQQKVNIEAVSFWSLPALKID